MKKKILIVTSEFPPEPGGIGAHAYNLALQLALNGYAVEVIADQRLSDASQEVVYDNSLPFRVHRIRLRSLRFLMYLERLVLLFKLLKDTDHVIATGKFSLWSVAFATIFYRRPSLAIIHGTEVNFKGFLLRNSIDLALKRFSSIVAVSHFTKQLIAHLQLDVQVIPNGYQPEKWQDLTPSPMQLKGFPKLITVGNVTSRKGQQHVIQMLPTLIEQYPDVHYHCVGLPTETATFVKLAIDLNVDSHVSFHGRLDDADLQAMLLQSDVFVMLSSETSTGDVEGFGIAILEANALGVPAIGAKDCGIENAINDGRSGILIDGGNAQAFLEAIELILKSREQFKAGALEWASRHHWEDIVKQYFRVLEGDCGNF